MLEIGRDGSFPDNIVIRELSDSDRQRYEEENEERVQKELELCRTNIISLKVYDVKYSMNSKKTEKKY